MYSTQPVSCLASIEENSSEFPALPVSFKKTVVNSSSHNSMTSSNYKDHAFHSYSDKLRNTGKNENFISTKYEYQGWNISEEMGKKACNFRSNRAQHQNNNKNVHIHKLQFNGVTKTVPYSEKFNNIQVQNQNFNPDNVSEKSVSYSSRSGIFLKSEVQAHMKEKKLFYNNKLRDTALCTTLNCNDRLYKSGAQVSSTVTTNYKCPVVSSSANGLQLQFNKKSYSDICDAKATHKWQSFCERGNSGSVKCTDSDGNLCNKNTLLKSNGFYNHHKGNQKIKESNSNNCFVEINKKPFMNVGADTNLKITLPSSFQTYSDVGSKHSSMEKQGSPYFDHVTICKQKEIMPNISSKVVALKANDDLRPNHTHSSSFESSAYTQKSKSQQQKATSVVRENKINNNAHLPQQPIETKLKKRRRRPSKLKRQTAFQTGKLLILSPELHSRITGQLSGNISHQAQHENVVCDINNSVDYPELALSNYSVKNKNLKQTICKQSSLKQDFESRDRGLKSDGKTVNENFQKEELEKNTLELKTHAETEPGECKGSENEEFKVKACPRDPVQLSDILSSTERQIKPQKSEHATKVVSTKRSKLNRNIHGPNVLDSSAPNKRRGKEREKPKHKRRTPLKKIILLEREQKKSNRHNVEQGKQCVDARDSDGTEQYNKAASDCRGIEKEGEKEIQCIFFGGQSNVKQNVGDDGEKVKEILEFENLSNQDDTQQQLNVNSTKKKSYSLLDISGLLNASCSISCENSSPTTEKACNDSLAVAEKLKKLNVDENIFEPHKKVDDISSRIHTILQKTKEHTQEHTVVGSINCVFHSESCANLDSTASDFQNVNTHQIVHDACEVAETIVKECFLLAKQCMKTGQFERQNTPSEGKNAVFCLTDSKSRNAIHCETENFNFEVATDSANMEFSNTKQLFLDSALGKTILQDDNENQSFFQTLENKLQNQVKKTENECIKTDIQLGREELCLNANHINENIKDLHVGNTHTAKHCEKITASVRINRPCALYKIRENEISSEVDGEVPIICTHAEEKPTFNSLGTVLEGNKRLKAVQIVLHTKSFREYCYHLLSKELDDAVMSLLNDLYRFQDRAYKKDPTKAHKKRRLVFGIKEVTKHLKLKKLKCVIVAPNLEDIRTEGGLNDALATLIRLCNEYHAPCIFASGRKQLGRISHKPVPISCIGIFNYDGSESHFKEVMEYFERSIKDYREICKIIRETLLPADVNDLLNAAETAPQTLLPVRTRVFQSVLAQLESTNNEIALNNFKNFTTKYAMRI